MRAYVAVMHKDEGSEYGLSFPDFPGCVGAGETAQAAVEDALVALTGHVELLVAEGQAVPEPSSVDDVLSSGEAIDGTLVLVPAPRVAGKSIRVNITLPDEDLIEFDRFCRVNYLTRSGFILSACRIAIEQADFQPQNRLGEPSESDNTVVFLEQSSTALRKAQRQ